MSAKETFTVKLKSNRKTGGQELLIEGDLGSANAEALKKKLQANEYTGDLNITIQNVDSLDLTAIQLLYSTLKSLSVKGFHSTVSVALSDRHDAILRNTGFTEFIRKQ